MMTDDELRVSIAEKCGWSAIENNGGAGGWIAKMPDGHALWDNCLGATRLDAIEANCPDYLEDLNAMHEAEKVLTSRQRCVFEVEVLRITTGKEKFDYDRGDLIAVITATARQRAEAFARVCWPERFNR